MSRPFFGLVPFQIRFNVASSKEHIAPRLCPGDFSGPPSLFKPGLRQTVQSGQLLSAKPILSVSAVPARSSPLLSLRALPGEKRQEKRRRGFLLARSSYPPPSFFGFCHRIDVGMQYDAYRLGGITGNRLSMAAKGPKLQFLRSPHPQFGRLRLVLPN